MWAGIETFNPFPPLLLDTEVSFSVCFNIRACCEAVVEMIFLKISL